MALEQVSCVKMFDGLQKVFSHASSETKTKMTFGIFLPSQAEQGWFMKRLTRFKKTQLIVNRFI